MLQFPEIFGLWSLPFGSEVVLLLLLGWVLVAQGAKHGYHYSFRKNGQKETTPDWFPELHWTDRRMMWGMYALLAAAGCDLVRVLLMQSVARPGFQYFIDVGATGEPFTELGEYGEKNTDGTWQTIQKGIIGRGRLWLAALNLLILLFYEPALHFLLDNFL